jgi:hypothetical protein
MLAMASGNLTASHGSEIVNWSSGLGARQLSATKDVNKEQRNTYCWDPPPRNDQ